MSDFKQFFSETAEQNSLAETLAKEAFVAANPTAPLVRARLRVDEPDRFVVVITYGPLAAPAFCCYVVAKGTHEVSELTDAAAYLPKPR